METIYQAYVANIAVQLPLFVWHTFIEINFKNPKLKKNYKKECRRKADLHKSMIDLDTFLKPHFKRLKEFLEV